MKSIRIILAAVAAASLVSSCKFVRVAEGVDSKFWGEEVQASEVLETRSIVVSDFDSIDFGTSCRVEYVPGDYRLEVETHENVFDHLDFTVEDGVLKLSQDNYNIRNMNTLNIYVQSPVLSGATFSGAAEFRASKGIEAETFKLSAFGASSVRIDGLDAASVDLTLTGASKLRVDGLDSQELKINVSGAGNCDISGMTGSADVTIAGAGGVDLSDLKVDELATSVSGAGNVIKPRD